MDRFLDDLAAPTPTPGGGAAACYVGATAAAIVEMCAGLGQKRGRQGAEDVAQRARALRRRLLEQAAIDCAAFDEVLSAYRIPKDDSARAGAIATALRGAALSPLQMLDELGELATLLAHAKDVTPAAASSDWESAVVFARAASDVAARNVRVNLDGAAGAAELGSQLEAKLESLERKFPEA